jgi:hypothetical protein
MAKLSAPQTRIFRRIAGHKYGWCYISRREISAADALERRGLVEYGVAHDRDHWDCPQVSATDAGKAFVQLLWPSSPFARGTYEAASSTGKEGSWNG